MKNNGSGKFNKNNSKTSFFLGCLSSWKGSAIENRRWMIFSTGYIASQVKKSHWDTEIWLISNYFWGYFCLWCFEGECRTIILIEWIFLSSWVVFHWKSILLMIFKPTQLALLSTAVLVNLCVEVPLTRCL